MKDRHTVVALPSGRRGQVADGASLRTALRGLGVEIESICAENATCGKCKVLIEGKRFEEYGITSSHGNLSVPRAEETDYLTRRAELFRKRGWSTEQVRLSCQARVHGDVVVTVPEESRAGQQIVRKSAADRFIEVRPSLRKYLVEMSPPTLSNPKADWDRLASGTVASMGLVRSGESGLPSAGELRIDAACLRMLPEILRKAAWRVTVSVWQGLEVVRVEPDFEERLVGAAVDIGTTTIAVFLCDLNSGETLATRADINPQTEFGEDVMSRIQHSTINPDGLQQLHSAVIRKLNQLLLLAAADAGIAKDDISELVMVGNTTMQHLFLNISPRYLGTAPFAPVTSQSIDLKARELRIAINPSANVHVLPAIASFIGADTTAVLLAEDPYEQDEEWLIIDIGTNAELVVGNRRRLVCASTPTGPAFEGGHIEFGMRAAQGAIERVRIVGAEQRPEWKLVDETEWGRGVPKGLCGSAVVDLVAELVRIGLLDGTGKFTRPRGQGRLREGASGVEYVVAYSSEDGSSTDICLTQNDVRQVQLAKAALFVAAESLLDRCGLSAPDKLLLAGAFGSYLDKQKAMDIGMLPRMDPSRVFVVGNAAGDGARIALLNVFKRRGAAAVAARVTRHELPADPTFQARFMRALAFPQS